ncbi:hypothetical protein GHT06_019207 [Daphnia sinensis]|uniref:Peptidase S1 domain-containing protein n=1 Tax=Daphnia sinensis TaxID=1820382 RepID=A0AAD5PNB4_9CRUS|nr:hypothetical protein GHT06_019207 [Daphnia sinensis]
MTRLRHLIVFVLLAALLLSCRPVSSGLVYQTEDAIVVEVEDIGLDRQDVSKNDAETTTVSIEEQTTLLANSSDVNQLIYLTNSTFTKASELINVTTTTMMTTSEATTTRKPPLVQGSIFSDSQCGIGPAKTLTMEEQRIVGGTEAVENSWPGIVALRKNGTFICGGSLLSRTKILTAAHCIATISPRDVKLLTVDLGIHVLLNQAAVTRKVKRMTRHRRFNARTFYSDIAILTLETPVEYSETISPVCLPSADSDDKYVDRDVTIIGWGSPIEGGFQSHVLRQVTVQVMSNAKCQKFYAGKDKIFDHMMCAAAPGKDSCQGDSGGPLLVQSSPGSTWIQAGVVSWGIGCARREYPGVFIRVSSFLNWIRRHMRS